MRDSKDKVIKDRYGTTSENDIIYKEKQNDSSSSMMVNKHKGVKHSTNETMRQKKTTEFIEPGPQSLF